MLLYCSNKSCGASTDAKLNVDTLEVICQECKRPITNIADTMKRVLKSSGQIIRDEQRKAFTMGCKNCAANRQVVLDKNDNTVCNICANVINVHPAMKQAVIEAGIRLEKQSKKEKTKTVKKSVKKKGK